MKLTLKIFATLLLVIGYGPLALSQTQSLEYKQNPNQISKKFNGDVDFTLGAFSYVEALDDSKIVQFSVTPTGDLSFDNGFGVRGSTNLNVTAGRTQTRFQNPNFQFLNILEAVAYYNPTEFFNAELGAINLEHFDNRMFLADRSFPGVKLESGIVTEKYSVRPKVMYAIPTSTSFEADRAQAEELPTLNTFGVEAFWAPTTWFETSANVNHFKYDNLPSITAFDSARLGNSVIGIDPSESRFRYNFSGISQAYELKFQYLPKVAQSFDFTIVENFDAPSDRRRSQSIGTQLDLDFNTWVFKPDYALFFAESDSVPAIYSAFEMGRNNREGYNLGFEIELKNMGMTVKAHYLEAKLIENRPLQADLQILDLALEFNDVVF